MSINLRFLTPADMEVFRDLRLQGLKETPKSYLHIYDEEVQKPDSYHEGMLVNHKVVGAFDDGVLVAFVFMSISGVTKQKHKCLVWGAYVKPEYRNLKIGQKMRMALFAHGKELGLTHCLSSIVADNPASLAMHEGVGYTQMYTEKHGLRHRDGTFSDLIHLVRPL